MKLALVLPVARTTIERAFSAMNLIKSILHNRMKDVWLNDCLVMYIERETSLINILDQPLEMDKANSTKKNRLESVSCKHVKTATKEQKTRQQH
ncbi:HAT [Theobroma cacao]|nr:HAT [Theobroma cacao]